MHVKNISENDFIKVLSQIGELENALIPVMASDSDKYIAPVVKWRWKNEKANLEAELKEIVNRYSGMRWYISRSEGGSWFLTIKQLMTELEGNITMQFQDFLNEWSKINSDICLQAHEEILLLAKYIATEI
ncbi:MULTISPECIES: hypothetical protein [Methylomonas]|uniref:hypothetical protein n=1 Tax=Methylomonas TaxID=416 RepID=UPI001231C024|nr:hypothetical protein [Methylomonas rhizoryzae]